MTKLEDQSLLLFKVDFEKAFDSVNWNFLLDVMRQMGFDHKWRRWIASWRRWIASCLSSASISILVNGSPSNEFLMERVRLSNSRVNVPLLQFADDALFFGEWSRLNAYNLINILRCFELASGLKVNLEVDFLELGPPVGRKMRLCDGWQGIIDRFRDRLSLWNAKTLSVGGRLTLIIFVLGSLPVYYLSLFKAPMSVLKVLDSIRCRFFQGHNVSEKGIKWVKWKSILLGSDRGGLGVGCLQSKNLSLLAK
nr:putative RNA-directed DNA polymerase, eukaryota, reverse transcriptase zinc-binding domain protein [Tanacetum cinerariifolium]